MKIKRFNKEVFKQQVRENAKLMFRKNVEEISKEQMFQAVALTVKDEIIDDWIDTHKAYEKQDVKILYYMSMEFLMGRALGNMLIMVSTSFLLSSTSVPKSTLMLASCFSRQ